MYKVATLLILALSVGPLWQEEESADPELQRQEIVNLENEAARAIPPGATMKNSKKLGQELSLQLEPNCV